MLSKFTASSISPRPAPSLARFASILSPFYKENRAERPPPAKVQLPPPAGEKGYWHYERDFARDSRYTKPISHIHTGGTALRLFTWILKEHYEIHPFIYLAIGATILGLLMPLYSALKVEVWLDRSTITPPWDWARIRNRYWKLPTVLYDPLGMTHERLGVMEQLEDELLEAAKKRGTRDERGYFVQKND